MKKNLLFSILCSLILMQPLMAQEIVSQDIFIKYAEEGNVAEIQRLIAAGVNVNQQNRFGHTALTLAIDNERTEVVHELLLTPGIDVNQEGWNSPLVGAIRMRQPALVRLLLRKGANVNQQEDNSGYFALMEAVYVGGQTEIVQMLLEIPGIDVNLQDDSGDTALMEAVAAGGSTDFVSGLLDKGADVNLQNRYGLTALMLAADRRRITMLRDLLDAGANRSFVNLNGQTALSFAIDKKFKNGIKELIKAGADYEPYIEVPIVQQTLRELKGVGTFQQLREREIGGRIPPRRFGAPQLLESGSALGKRKRG